MVFIITFKLEESSLDIANKLEELRLKSYGINPSPKDYDSYYIENIVNGNMLAFTCSIDNKLVSGCYISNAFNSIYIDYLFVLKEYQNKGLHIGRQLLQFILDNKTLVEEYYKTVFTESRLYALTDKTKEIYNNMGYKEEQATNLLCKKLDN